jgi:hypothetical protein
VKIRKRVLKWFKIGGILKGKIVYFFQQNICYGPPEHPPGGFYELV